MSRRRPRSFSLVVLSAVFASALSVASPSAGAQTSAPSTIQAVIAVPSNGTSPSDRVAAAQASLSVVEDWYEAQTGGRYPVFNRADGSIDVRVVTLSKTRAELHALGYADMSTLLRSEIDSHVPASATSELFVYLENTQNVAACGYSGSLIVIPMENCSGIYPSASASFPYGDTYLVAHELAHMLGGVASCAPNAIPGGHLDDDPRDILYQGPEFRDWDNLMLDPGNDDYYNHGRSDCVDISNSPLLGTWETNGPGDPVEPPATAWCAGQVATIVGTAGDDVLLGTDGVDVIAGLQGDDIIRGFGGEDILCGGRGNDIIYGGEGFDILYGAQDDDVLFAANGESSTDRADIRGARMFGGEGNDRIVGSNRWDRMQGGLGADVLIGFEGRDWMRAGGGNDVVDGGTNIDDMHGGNGNDRIAVDNADSVRGGAGAKDRCVLTANAQPTLLVSCELS